ncbi:hypothetical protein F5146DRAFT_1138535 [Armillaria mellea]|nr:hypothetical protein F5146DRAFT_1138535 [Armillaria mellea]
MLPHLISPPLLRMNALPYTSARIQEDSLSRRLLLDKTLSAALAIWIAFNDIYRHRHSRQRLVGVTLVASMPITEEN